MQESHAGIQVTLTELIRLRFAAQSIDLRAHKKVRSQLLGGHLSSIRGRGMDFDEVRAYQAGDDIRAMDWRVTARTNKAHVKLYHEERERPVLLLADFRPNMFFGTKVAFKSVVAAKAAALLAWATFLNGDRLGGVIFSGQTHVELRPRARGQGVLPFLQSLTDYAQLTAADSHVSDSVLSEALLRLRRVARPGSLIFLISDFAGFGQEAKRQLDRLAQHNELIACSVRDPIELDPPPAAMYPVTDGERVMLMDCQSTQNRQAYRQYFAKRYQDLKSVLSSRLIPLIELTTDQDPAQALARIFQQRTRRGAV
jgi:uncharacterized protein (DUF58 family)